MNTARARAVEAEEKQPESLFSPNDPAAYASPIDFIWAEHDRQLAICDLIERLARNPRHCTAAAAVAAVRDHLVRDLALHVADEEEDLFPLLRRRCPKSDGVDEIFALLQQEHEVDLALHRSLVGDLDALIAGYAFADPARFMMNAFAYIQAQRRHIAWENVVILPRARRHLTADDRAMLAQAIAKRHAGCAT